MVGQQRSARKEKLEEKRYLGKNKFLSKGVTAISRFQGDPSRQKHVFAKQGYPGKSPQHCWEIDVWMRDGRSYLLHVGPCIVFGFFFKLR